MISLMIKSLNKKILKTDKIDKVTDLMEYFSIYWNLHLFVMYLYYMHM